MFGFLGGRSNDERTTWTLFSDFTVFAVLSLIAIAASILINSTNGSKPNLALPELAECELALLTKFHAEHGTVGVDPEMVSDVYEFVTASNQSTNVRSELLPPYVYLQFSQKSDEHVHVYTVSAHSGGDSVWPNKTLVIDVNTDNSGYLTIYNDIGSDGFVDSVGSNVNSGPWFHGVLDCAAGVFHTTDEARLPKAQRAYARAVAVVAAHYGL